VRYRLRASVLANIRLKTCAGFNIGLYPASMVDRICDDKAKKGRPSSGKNSWKRPWIVEFDLLFLRARDHFIVIMTVGASGFFTSSTTV
jgi:hypothetical protein